MSTTASDVLAQLAVLLEQLDPQAGEIIVRLDGPCLSAMWRISAEGSRRLTEMERTILAAACEHPEEGFTAEKLAKLAGYGNSPRFRASLSGLRRLRLLLGQPGDSGYAITPGGRELLAMIAVQEEQP